MDRNPMAQKYWDMFFDFKVSEYYYQLYSVHAHRQRNLLSALTTVGSAAFVLTWYQTGILPLLWGSLILIAQVLTALQPLLPFEKRMTAACYICSDLVHLNLEVEMEWYRFKIDSSEDEYREKIDRYRKEYDRIEERFSDPYTFPKHKRLFKEAQESAQIYFRGLE